MKGGYIVNFNRILLGIIFLLFVSTCNYVQAAERFQYLGDRDSNGEIKYFLDMSGSKMLDSNIAQVNIFTQATQMPDATSAEIYLYDFSRNTVKLVRTDQFAYGKLSYTTKGDGHEDEMNQNFHFVDKVYAFLHDPSYPQNSFPHVAPNAPAQSNTQNNKFPSLPANWNGLKLTKSGTTVSKLNLDMSLGTEGAIRGIVINQPRTDISDNGTLYFYLNNGDFAGITFFQDQISFWLSWEGQKRFDEAIWNNGSLHKSSSYNSSIAFYVPGDGYLYVGVVPLNNPLQNKAYKFKLPEGAEYFNGKCHENVLIADIGIYQ